MVTNDKYKILIVGKSEDEKANLYKLLQSDNYNLNSVSDELEVLSVILSKLPDLIIFDSHDAFDIRKLIDSNLDKVSEIKIPVLFIVDSNEIDSYLDYLTPPFVDFIAKPYKKIELLSKIKTFEILKKAQSAINLQQGYLNELNVAKNTIISFVTQNLKNPFVNLVELSEMLIANFDKLEAEKIKRFHNLIYKSSLNGFELLENLLQWSKIQIGELTTEPVHINIRSLIINCLETYSNAINRKKIDLSVNINSDSNAYADINMATTIIRNLLSNAVKFTKKSGKIEIIARNVDNFTEICIVDNGKGLRSDEIKNLFKFNSLTGSYRGVKKKGAGLGLIICKELAELNAGKITVESEYGVGSNFCFILPVK